MFFRQLTLLALALWHTSSAGHLERLSNRIESVENKLTEVANVLLSIGGDTSDLHSIGKGNSTKPTTPEGKGKCSSTNLYASLWFEL